MFYNGNEPGIPLKSNQVKSLISGKTIQGYFEIKDINAFMDQPDCVGVRFYNVSQKGNVETQLIAVGVLSNGYEIAKIKKKNNYLLSPPLDVNLSRNLRKAKSLPENIARDTYLYKVKNRGNISNNNKTFFATYFSKSALRKIDKQNPKASKIGFYTVQLFDNVDAPYTHLAVAGGIKKGAFKTIEGAGVISTMPCPPVCSPEDNNAPCNALINSPNIFISFSKYLVAWN